MANLAIKGHATRGNEVIEILEMLGGKHKIDSEGLKWFNGTNIDLYYTIKEDNYIHIHVGSRKDGYIKFTLEEFLKKFPYKVGDKVIYENIKREITKMVWEEHTNTVAYKLDDKLYCNVIKELQPYKEETMAQLAIKGHATRGKEVIEILEMLGGTNRENCWGIFDTSLYLINALGDIEERSLSDDFNYQTYTLEEFLEKFPYKIGDKVIAYVDGCLAQFTIQGIRWNHELNRVEYRICSSWSDTSLILPYKEKTTDKANKAVFDANAQCCDIMNNLIKEETMNRKYNVEEYLKVWEETENGLEVVVNDNFELKEDNGKFYIIKKQLQYPKTYEECHKLMVQWKEYDCNPNSELILCESPIHDFCKLIVARNIYWKIAGEQMGLGKPWKPDFTDFKEERYGLYTKHQTIVNVYGCGDENIILVFPTAEMRDVFLENFKDLIESCKELL